MKQVQADIFHDRKATLGHRIRSDMKRHANAILVIGVALLLSGAVLAQQNQQQKPPPTQSKPEMSMDSMMKGCREHCERMSASMDRVMQMMEEAKQSNDVMKMRAALEQAPKPLSDMKQHMTMCTSMMGMMEKMHGMGGMMRGQKPAPK